MDEQLIVYYKNQAYDITDFRHKHPGGVNTLKSIQNTDISYRFDNAPPHSAAAKYLMHEYRLQSADDRNNDADAMQNDDAVIQTDESMEVGWFDHVDHVNQTHNIRFDSDSFIHYAVISGYRTFSTQFYQVIFSHSTGLTHCHLLLLSIVIIYNLIQQLTTMLSGCGPRV